MWLPSVTGRSRERPYELVTPVSESRHPGDDPRDVLRAAQEFVDYDVLVRGVRVAVRLADAGVGDRHTQVLDERVHRAGAAADRGDRQRLAVERLGRVGDKIDEGAI